MQRWFSGENWVQKMPVFLPAHRVAHQPTRSRIFTYTFKSILIFAEKGWFDAVIYFISFHCDTFSVVLQNDLFRLRFDRLIMSHQTVSFISLLHVWEILLFVKTELVACFIISNILQWSKFFSALLGVLSLHANSSRKLLGDGQVIVFVPYSGSLVQKEKIFWMLLPDLKEPNNNL